MVESMLKLGGCVLTARKTTQLVIIIVRRKRTAVNDFIVVLRCRIIILSLLAKQLIFS